MRILRSLLITFAVVSLSNAQDSLEKLFPHDLVTCEPNGGDIARAKGGNQTSLAAIEAVKQGFNFWRSGEFKQSGASYQRAVDLDPSLYAAQFNLGLTQLQSTEYTHAVLAFTEALHLSPDSLPAWQKPRLRTVLRQAIR
jgi:tetratricopeptide (TPR) repeat protein